MSESVDSLAEMKCYPEIVRYYEDLRSYGWRYCCTFPKCFSGEISDYYEKKGFERFTGQVAFDREGERSPDDRILFIRSVYWNCRN